MQVAVLCPQFHGDELAGHVAEPAAAFHDEGERLHLRRLVDDIRADQYLARRVPGLDVV